MEEITTSVFVLGSICINPPCSTDGEVKKLTVSIRRSFSVFGFNVRIKHPAYPRPRIRERVGTIVSVMRGHMTEVVFLTKAKLASAVHCCAHIKS